MQVAFSDSFLSEVPFRQDRELAPELALELEPVLDALVEIDLASPSSGVEHEAAALVTLLSRRAAMLGATPTAAGAMLRGLFAALRRAEITLGERAQRDLTSLVFEGYAAGCEERSANVLQRAMARAHALVELSPRLFTLRFLPAVDAQFLATALAEVERELLRRDALVLINELSALTETSEDQARTIMELVETARSLGVRVIFASASAAFWAQVGALNLDTSDIVRHDGFAAALADALRTAGYEIKPRRRWSRPFFRKGLLRERRVR